MLCLQMKQKRLLNFLMRKLQQKERIIAVSELSIKRRHFIILLQTMFVGR